MTRDELIKELQACPENEQVTLNGIHIGRVVVYPDWIDIESREYNETPTPIPAERTVT